MLGLAFFVLVASAGYGLLRLLGLHRGLFGLGLAPGAGLALLAVLCAWRAWLALPLFLSPFILLVAALAGLILAVRDRWVLRWDLWSGRNLRLAAALTFAALALPAVILGGAFAGVEVPLSSHDGGFHAEAIHALRQGAAWEGWYPPGYHTIAAAFLQLTPWVDTAHGSVQASLALAGFAPLAVLALAYAVWRKALIAAVAALVIDHRCSRGPRAGFEHRV